MKALLVMLCAMALVTCAGSDGTVPAADGDDVPDEALREEAYKFFDNVGVSRDHVSLSEASGILGNGGHIDVTGTADRGMFSLYRRYGGCSSSGEGCGAWYVCFASENESLRNRVAERYCEDFEEKYYASCRESVEKLAESHCREFGEHYPSYDSCIEQVSEGYDFTAEMKEDCYAGEYSFREGGVYVFSAAKRASRCHYTMRDGPRDCI